MISAIKIAIIKRLTFSVISSQKAATLDNNISDSSFDNTFNESTFSESTFNDSISNQLAINESTLDNRPLEITAINESDDQGLVYQQITIATTSEQSALPSLLKPLHLKPHRRLVKLM